MSAMPNEPYRAKKLQASERDQQNHKQIVLASAIEIIVVITSLIGARLMASKHARMQAVLALISALCLASPVTNAIAASITVEEPTSDGFTDIFVSGDITPENVLEFNQKIAHIADKTKAVVVLMSRGGTGASIFIGETIRQSGMSTPIWHNQVCASACSLIWLAGAHRYLGEGAHIGFHGLYDADTGQQSVPANANGWTLSWRTRAGL